MAFQGMHLEGMHPMGAVATHTEVAMGAAMGVVVFLEAVGDFLEEGSPVVVVSRAVVVTLAVVVILAEVASGHGSRGSHRGSTRGTLRKALTIR